MSYVSRKSWKNRSSGLGYSVKKGYSLRSFILFLFLIFVVFELVSSVFIISYRVESISMEPTIPSGAVIMATPLSYSPAVPFVNTRIPGFRTPRRGDLVVADPAYRENFPWYKTIPDSFIRFFTLQKKGLGDENNWAGSSSVKRIIGLPGDTVKMADSVMYIRPPGKSTFFPESELMHVDYSTEVYVKPDLLTSDYPLSGYMDEITLGEDEYFIAGDNRSLSDDSCYWGPVSIEKLKARVLFEYAPEIKSLQ